MTNKEILIESDAAAEAMFKKKFLDRISSIYTLIYDKITIGIETLTRSNNLDFFSIIKYEIVTVVIFFKFAIDTLWLSFFEIRKSQHEHCVQFTDTECASENFGM